MRSNPCVTYTPLNAMCGELSALLENYCIARTDDGLPRPPPFREYTCRSTDRALAVLDNVIGVVHIEDQRSQSAARCLASNPVKASTAAWCKKT